MLTWRTEEEEENSSTKKMQQQQHRQQSNGRVSPVEDENRRVCGIDHVCLEQQKTILKLEYMKLLSGIIKYI